jgi:hypothetical protein
LLTIHWPSRLPSTLVRDAPPTCPEGYEGMCPWLVINCNQTSCLLCCNVSLFLNSQKLNETGTLIELDHSSSLSYKSRWPPLKGERERLFLFLLAHVLLFVLYF